MAGDQYFALVDCNNFYASCEKLFRPDLKNTPVVVLSNNDGCVVARSPEAKALDIPMGVPAFQIQHLVKKHGIIVFSSNYALYADLSHRVMQAIESCWPDMEIYSIDEAFLTFSSNPLPGLSMEGLAEKVQKRVLMWTGLRVSIGVARTKTLAKIANYAAKKYPATKGVVVLEEQDRIDRLLALVSVGEVWGVGRRTQEKLCRMNVRTAFDLKCANILNIKRFFNIKIGQTVEELNGSPCFTLEQTPGLKKQMICSRSFGERIKRKDDMEKAVSSFCVYVAERLRSEKLLAGRVDLFIRTSCFNKDKTSYANSCGINLDFPSDDTFYLVGLTCRLLDCIWKEGKAYSKAGVVLSVLTPGEGGRQMQLFESSLIRPQHEKVIEIMDRINREKKGKVLIASQGLGQNPWKMKQSHVSPNYTLDWRAIPIIRC
ncbi:Y-family DNA polymerase [Desulfobotulus sp. H1]|uniref:Y-family DNA polymerase n=1 Tax=Desulfobotulus pelophilus TaxID=2823377 RepID=A0ABT3N867_9BACT|nr:Y-family DNA polymerase [Desulfobotulus pelophilus]MCW7753645.1 Y-family DNA polymerase [Desulfobotulus pelophilus]